MATIGEINGLRSKWFQATQIIVPAGITVIIALMGVWMATQSKSTEKYEDSLRESGELKARVAVLETKVTANAMLIALSNDRVPKDEFRTFASATNDTLREIQKNVNAITVDVAKLAKTP